MWFWTENWSVNDLIQIKLRNHFRRKHGVLSLQNIVKGRFAINAPISLTLRAHVTAIKKLVFIDNNKQVAIGSKGGFMRFLRTKLRFQTGVGACISRKRFPRPLMNPTVAGWPKRKNPSLVECGIWESNSLVILGKPTAENIGYDILPGQIHC